MTGEKINWIVNAWHPAGLAVGDHVVATARQGDPWYGEFRGEIKYIRDTAKEKYAHVSASSGDSWDIDLVQLRVETGERRLEVWLNASNATLVHTGAYRHIELALFQFPLGWLEIRLEHVDNPRQPSSAARQMIGSARVRIHEDEELELLVRPLLEGKPAGAEIELVHPNKERWTWEHEFPLRVGPDGLVYCCLGTPDDLPDIVDMMDLPDDEKLY